VPAYLERQKIKTDVEIVAVADICEARGAEASRALPHARRYATYEELLAAESANLDFVDICTPPAYHAVIAHAALDRGLHVLCEKPLTTTREDAVALLQHAAKARRVIFPCHNYKHAPIVVAIRDVIASGRIGKVRSVSLSTYRTSHARGVAEWNPHWRRQLRHSGGGIAMDHGSHSFYLAFDWMGGWPTAVSARVFSFEAERYDTEDNFSAVLTFPNGVVNAQLSWTAGVRKVLYVVQGDQGAITADDDDLQIAMMRTPHGIDVPLSAITWETERRSISSEWMDASHTRWFNAMFDQFALAIANDDFAGKEAQDAQMCIDIITTSYDSARQGGRDLAVGSQRQRAPGAATHDLRLATAVAGG
jgi:predicted dehydrogenase